MLIVEHICWMFSSQWLACEVLSKIVLELVDWVNLSGNNCLIRFLYAFMR